MDLLGGILMGKVVITVKDKYFLIDDETGEVKQVIIQDKQSISNEEMREIIKYLVSKDKN
jgi:hypothetical protein